MSTNVVRSFADSPSWSYFRSLASEHNANVVIGTNVTIDEKLIPALEGFFPGSIILIHSMSEGILIMVARS